MKVQEPRSRREEIKIVGKSGQISLGKSYAGKMLRLERFDDGRIVLTSVAVVPESQLGEPARSKIERGLEWAADTKAKQAGIDQLIELLTRVQAEVKSIGIKKADLRAAISKVRRRKK